MRILLANPNTTEGITALMAAAARATAAPGTEIKPVTAGFGAAVIGSRMEMVVGDYASLALVAREADGCDAVIVAAAIDSGLRAIKQMLPVPVVGLTESAIHAANLTGGRFGLVVSSTRTGAVMREMVEGYGLGSRLAGIRALGSDAGAVYGDLEGSARAITTAACLLAEEDHAEAVVLIGAVMAGMPARIADRVPVPVLDGIAAGVGLCEMLVRLQAAKPRAGSLAHPGPRPTVGLAGPLAALLKPA
jgi:allantoin racemase